MTASIAFRYFAGGGAPFPQFLLLASLYAAAIHPAQRALGVLAASTAAAFTPLAYDAVSTTFWANTVAQVALWWSLGLIVLVWLTRTRNQRREINAAREEAEQHARIDTLTGLGNRRALEEELITQVAGARRYDHPLSALVGDLDAFKAVNDTFGHPAGDSLLEDVARAFKAAVRVPDPCFRWGGDEFVALLPGADLDEARAIAERVTTAVALGTRTPEGKPMRISVGVAELSGLDAPEDLLKHADEALLAVKETRRGRGGGLRLTAS